MQIAEKLETLHRLAHRHWMKLGTQLGLSYSEFEYLSAVKEQEELTAAGDFNGQHLHDLVTAMGVNKASASAMMDKLEKRKLVRVKKCKRDGRAKLFFLTKKGEALRMEGKAAYRLLVETLSTEQLGLVADPKADDLEKASPKAQRDEVKDKPKVRKKAKNSDRIPEKPADNNAELPQLSLFG